MASLNVHFLSRGRTQLQNNLNSLNRTQSFTRLNTPVSRHASHATTTPSKPIVLEKPARFNPPSHPARLKKLPRHYPGPPIMGSTVQRRKRYPHMMPAKGTFWYWFLTNRGIHLWITLGTLFSLAIFTFFADFLTTTPYRDLLPANETFTRHPIMFIARWLEVYKMHVDYISAVTAEKRRRKIEDVRKRAAYRKAHGEEWERKWFGWDAKGDDGDDDDRVVTGPAPNVDGGQAAVEGAGHVPTEEEREAYANWNGRRRSVKKWLGIW